MYTCGLNRFYNFVGYSDTLAIDSRIIALASALDKVTDELEKKSIRREIVALSLKANN